MKVERILGRPRYWWMFRADTNEVCCVFDKVGICAVRFFGMPPKIGDIYKTGRLIPHVDASGAVIRHEQDICARVLRPVAIETIQLMLKAAGSRRRVKGMWYQVISD